MKTRNRIYRIKVTFNNGSVKRLQATDKKLILAGNVNKYIFSKFKDIKQIDVFCFNSNTGKYYKELTYNEQFENWKNNRTRIEAENKKGYEDYTGYGSRTNGKFNRFYIGKSTGFIPIYLEILSNNSSGGGALFLHGRKFRTV